MNRRAMFGQASPQADFGTSAFSKLCPSLFLRAVEPRASLCRILPFLVGDDVRSLSNYNPLSRLLQAAPEPRASVWTAGYAPAFECRARYQTKGPRTPKASTSFLHPSAFGLSPAGRAVCPQPAANIQNRPNASCSTLGFRPSFGLRISAFGLS